MFYFVCMIEYIDPCGVLAALVFFLIFVFSK